jgi:hypothetical protein
LQKTNAEIENNAYDEGWNDKTDDVYIQNNSVIYALKQAIKQEEQQPVPVKTYSGGKAWPVQTSAPRDDE